MRTLLTIARRAAAALLLGTTALALLFTVAARTDAVRVSRVLTGSMGRTVPPGSVVVSRPVTAGAIERGDIVMFLPPDPYDTGGTPVVHRVTRVDRAAGAVLLHTKGDANAAEDPWTVDASRSTVYRLAWSSFTAGRVADLVARGGGAMVLTVVVALAALRALVLLWRPRPARHRAQGLEWLRDAAA